MTASRKPTNQRFRLLARKSHGVRGATISEYVNDDNTRRFSATIMGFTGWFLWEGDGRVVPIEAIVSKAREIRDRIESRDGSVFHLSSKMPLVS